MALKCVGKHLCPLNAQIDATVLNGGDRGLRNSRALCQLALAEFLKFAQDPHRLTH